MDNFSIQTSLEYISSSKEKLHLFSENNKSNSLDARYIGSIDSVEREHKNAMEFCLPASLFLIGIPLLIFEISRYHICTTKIEINGKKFRVKKSDYRVFLKTLGVVPKKRAKLSKINLCEIIKQKVTNNPDKFEKAIPSKKVLRQTKEYRTRLLKSEVSIHKLHKIKEAILAGADINESITRNEFNSTRKIKTSQTGTLLGFALYRGDSELAEWLVAYGADNKAPFKAREHKYTSKVKTYEIDPDTLELNLVSKKKETLDAPNKTKEYPVGHITLEDLAIPST